MQNIIRQHYLISCFPRPVTNKKNQYHWKWSTHFKHLLAPPRILPEYTAEQKMKFGDYTLRGLIAKNGDQFPERNDENLADYCCRIYLDIDSPLTPDAPLPTPAEIHAILKEKNIAHAVHSSANPSRCRVVLPVPAYKKQDAHQQTWAFYCFLLENGLKFSYARENSTLSQPMFLPQTSDITRHVALGCKSGKKFTPDMAQNILPKIIEEIPVSAEENFIEVGTIPTPEWFIDQLQTYDTMHQAAKRLAGWWKKTTDWSVGQIFDALTGLVKISGVQKFIERWEREEREKLERWFETQEFNKSPVIVSDLPDDFFAEILNNEFCMDDEYLAGLGNETWVYESLVIERQITIIIAKPGCGKTSFFLNIGAQKMVENGYKVVYIDVDSPPSDHKMMHKIAVEGKFILIAPAIKKNKSIQMFMERIDQAIAISKNMSKEVYIFDTLKKFVDMMSKKDIKNFLSKMKQMTALGATIILLGHANKYLVDGMLKFEGTGDIEADCDGMIYFAAEHDNETRITKVSTIVDQNCGAKVRGIYESFTFQVSRDSRKVKLLDEDAVPVEYPVNENKTITQAVREVTNDGVLAVKAIEFLKENEGKEISFDTFVNGITSKMNIGVNRAKTFIRKNSRDDDENIDIGLAIFKFNKGGEDRRSKFYSLTDKSKVFKPENLFDA